MTPEEFKKALRLADAAYKAGFLDAQGRRNRAIPLMSEQLKLLREFQSGVEKEEA